MRLGERLLMAAQEELTLPTRLQRAFHVRNAKNRVGCFGRTGSSGKVGLCRDLLMMGHKYLIVFILVRC